MCLVKEGGKKKMLDKLNPFKRGTSEDELNMKKKEIAQEWLPIYDVNNSIMYRRDGYEVCAIHVDPINLELMSKREQKSTVKKLSEAFTQMNEFDWTIETVPKPVDLDQYIMSLDQDMQKTDNFVIRKILEQDKKFAAEFAASGEATDILFYIIVAIPPEKEGKKKKSVVKEKAQTVVSVIKDAGLNAHLCTDKELRELMFLFTHHSQATYERAPEDNGPYLPPVYESKEA